MEPKFNTSFIPKKSLQADTNTSSENKYVARRTVHGPGFYSMLLLFIISVTACVGVFAYTVIVDRSIEEKKNVLEEKKKAFKISIIDDLIETDARLSSANNLLANHIAISQIFNTLEDITLKRIQYTDFVYTGARAQTPAVLEVTGISDSFQDVALQTWAYRTNEYLHDPVVKELKRKSTNNIDTVDFILEAGVDTSLTSFSLAIKENRIGPNKKTDIIVPAVEDTIDEFEGVSSEEPFVEGS
jgi:hypothetical protein